MSVFKKLKGTFQKSQQDFIDGIRSFTTLDNQGRRDSQQSLKTVEVNLDTGADLLKNYQVNWSAIQTETRESAKKQRQEVASLMTPLFASWEKQTQSVTQLEEESRNIPNILAMLTQLHTLIDGLSLSFLAVDKELDVLQDICDEQEFQKKCLEEHRKLAMYKVKKLEKQNESKWNLLNHTLKKMIMLEAAKKKSLQERADAFTSAFQNDLNFYRMHGHPGRIPTEFPKVSSLSEIELDVDKQELDSFLGPSGETERSPGGNLELSGEGSYFEDDYTTDFSVKRDVDFQEDSNYIIASVIDKLDTDDENATMLPQNVVTSDSPIQSEEQETKEGSVEVIIDHKVNLSESNSLEVSQSGTEQDTHEKKEINLSESNSLEASQSGIEQEIHEEKEVGLSESNSLEASQSGTEQEIHREKEEETSDETENLATASQNSGTNVT